MWLEDGLCVQFGGHQEGGLGLCHSLESPCYQPERARRVLGSTKLRRPSGLCAGIQGAWADVEEQGKGFFAWVRVGQGLHPS